MSCVLFTSNRPLERAENLKAVYDAYDGRKRFAKFCDVRNLHSGRYCLQVTDELPQDTPGKCLFIGHGMGAGKTYGLDQPHPYFRKSGLVTCAIASSEEMIPTVAKQIGISESQVFPIGMPRTDEYFNSRIAPVEKNYLYAPTYRGGKWYPEWERLQLQLDEELVVKPHMVTKHILTRSYDRIVERNGMSHTTAEYLLKCSVLITDYSSIMFDAFVMRKPVVLFAKDKNEYIKNRGMYYKYPDRYSEYYCDAEEDLMEMVRTAEWNGRFENARRFYAGACDGNSTERVINLIRSMI